jgi:ABC-type proline/glycine betaine transport system permease subunit
LATFIGAQFAAGIHGKSKTPYILAGAAALVLLALTFTPKLWEKLHRKRG